MIESAFEILTGPINLDVEENTIGGGIPAKIIKSINESFDTK